MSDTHWAIVPFLDCLEYTKQVTIDLLAQTLPTRVLLINQGSSKETWEAMCVFVEEHHPDVLMWSWNPTLPSLSGAWNRGLRFVWELGGTEALVVNNDARLVPNTYERLLTRLHRTHHPVTGLLAYEAWFVSAVGKSEREWCDDMWKNWCAVEPGLDDMGGPDFSCFVIARAGHEKYPFDESFVPCYCEDLTAHREYMLGGDGMRIFSINIPYLHYASGTLKAFDPEKRAKFEKAYARVVEHYTRLWGGKPNQETYTRKGDPSSAQEGVTTPELQRRVQAGEEVYYQSIEGNYLLD